MTINGAKIGESYRSDHAQITIELKEDTMKRGKSFWKFNNSLLYDQIYNETVKEVIYHVRRQYAKKQDDRNIDTLSNDQLTFTISDQLFFETLLLEIRGKSISYASFKKKEQNKTGKKT